jgi:ribonuclease PH
LWYATQVRSDGRSLPELRPIEVMPGFHRNAEGSVLYRAGRTVVLCTASIDPSVPAWMAGRGKGWLTAEYQMHPRSSPERREGRDGRGKAPSGRTQEIQRLIGRALRAAVDLEALGERTITVDCDVLEADGGTRTAAISGGFIALALALAHLRTKGQITEPTLRDQVAAISVGHLEAGLALDLVYTEDSKARVDMNVVATGEGSIIEVQATAEGDAVPRHEIDQMIDLALAGVRSLCGVQRAAITAAGIDLDTLFKVGRGAWAASAPPVGEPGSTPAAPSDPTFGAGR